MVTPGELAQVWLTFLRSIGWCDDDSIEFIVALHYCGML